MSDKYKKLSKEELLRLVEKQEKELKTKKYGLVWDSEREPEQVVLDCEENLPILERVEEKEIKTDNSDDNILIEGDNYHALTVLNYTHRESIDVIYIDPPYNTGTEDWKYNNKYITEEDGYRHSKWLNMMEKRLVLAKKLLKEDGVLICTIDHNEQENLGLLLRSIFGSHEITCVTIVHNPSGIQGHNFSHNNEYAYFVYPKIEGIINPEIRNEKTADVRNFINGAKGNTDAYKRESGPDCFYPIIIKEDEIVEIGDICMEEFHPGSSNIKKDGGKIEVYPIDKHGVERKWLFTRDSVENILDELEVKYDSRNDIYKIIRVKNKINYKTVWTDNKYNAKKYGTGLLNQILDVEFPFPKSLYNTYDCIESVVRDRPESIILDYFAGSGTTGHAVLELNKEDDGNRKFILCTNNEVSADEEKDFKKKHSLSDSEFRKWQKEKRKEWLDFQEKNGICSAVCYPRIKKVIEGYDYEGKEKELVWEKDFTLNTLRSGKADEIYQEYEEKREEIKEKYDDYESSFENNVIRLYGVKEIKGKKTGLGGNLQYFKTSFVKKTKNSDQLKLNLTQKCAQMLCVKENIYNLEKEGDDYKIFSSNKKDKYLCIYYNFIDDSFNKFLKELKKINEEKKIYMFSTNNEVDKGLFEELENFSIAPIPQPILDIYRQLIRLNIKDK